METPTHFDSFEAFYPFYLSQHSDQTCRRLHFIGSSIGLVLGVSALVSRKPSRLLAGLAVGYGLAWVGHFFFEKNRPATFKFPLYSFMGDWVMYSQIWRGKIPF